ncbi:MAG: SAM-dependent methyltransferase [Betaproteobacteria bacterium]|nr:SAM-dependent methyltransferase [Betaproteobacteria bacterium]
MEQTRSLPREPAAAPAGQEQRAAGLMQLLRREIATSGGWIGFDRYMQLALYQPGLGYYAASPGVLGAWGGASDFITAPELSPLFAATLARQLGGLGASLGLQRVVEFGAGSAALACGLLLELAEAGAWLPEEYAIVEVSAGMRERQQAAVAALPAELARRVCWWESLPRRFDALVLGNEVLDAMPVRLLHHAQAGWVERGVGLDAGGALAWSERELPPGCELRPSLRQLPPGSVTEWHEAAEGFMRSLGEHLGRGVALLFDYGFPAREYDHPQRAGGTLRCHRAHRAHDDPLWEPGLSDITAHVDFSAMARAAREAGLDLLGYTSQARFLLNAGLLDLLAPRMAAGDAASLRLAAGVQKLLGEHEMGELFKVLAVGRGVDAPLTGFAQGDRSAALDDAPSPGAPPHEAAPWD